MISRADMIVQALQQTAHLKGEVWECGCFEGDMAAWMLPHVEDRPLRLFDTFEGQPFVGPMDRHTKGSMKADYTKVKARFKGQRVVVRRGLMPDTFKGLETVQLSVVNLDVDNEQTIRACLPWLYAHLQPGGYLFIDDYNCGSCPGAKEATNDFMRGKPESLVVSEDHFNPQAYLVKL